MPQFYPTQYVIVIKNGIHFKKGEIGIVRSINKNVVDVLIYRDHLYYPVDVFDHCIEPVSDYFKRFKKVEEKEGRGEDGLV
jgi:hypothetical protein